MKLFIPLLLLLAACENVLYSHTLEEAYENCANNGGLDYLRMSEDNAKGGNTPIWVYAHCKNGAQFELDPKARK